jgi:two-component system, LuxR family, sensor kinase FixL
MSWVTIIWSMGASACLTLAAIYFVVWLRNRTAWAHLLFSLTAVSTAAYAFCELWMMRAQTPAELVTAMRVAQAPMFVWLVSITWFIRVYLRAGRPWLAWMITLLRGLYLLLPFLAGINVNYQEVPALRHIEFLGESITVIGGTPNRLTLVGQFGVLLVLLFVADASLTAWRRGDRRQALMVGGGVEFFLFAGLATSSIVFWFNVRAPIVVSHCYLGMIAVMAYELSRDVLRASQLVHQLRASEVELRESEARMSMAVDAADLGLWTRDPAGRAVWANARWREMFNFDLAEAVSFDDVLRRVHADDREGLQQAIALAEGGSNEGRFYTEYRLASSPGMGHWVASSGRVEFDATGRPTLVRGATRDITARKHADEEMQLLRHEIAHVGRVSLMGQLASALAHEINQPLGAILHNAEAAELFLRKASPELEQVREILADIRRDDQRAAAVIDRMRRLLERHTLETRRLDVAGLVGEVAALVRADAASRQVRLDVDVPGDLPPVQGDRVHLQQVLINLIVNGMDALNGASPENRRVSVAARLDGAQRVEVAVDDGGPGIPADTMAQIFNPFFTTKPHGMGMGLAISRTIIEAHGGRLWAENRHGGGAAFRFTLQIAADSTAN